ncbi:hypothetical protein DERF_008759 [Dermatophagoides farinae]|uniref:Uncharacterized protein n=1 Tax=Dermatophagoides farinae TaxID=6954 RepID=A0A922I1K5_DERFA|nr:hypothetical protein DERF_008759 [Dermatophagoides farinae]
MLTRLKIIGPSRRHISSGTDNVSSTPMFTESYFTVDSDNFDQTTAKTSSSSPAVPPSTQWFNNYNQMNSFFNQNDNYGISSPTPPVICISSQNRLSLILNSLKELKPLRQNDIIDTNKDLKNLKINFHTLPLMKNLEILQKKRNEFSTNNDSNDRFDDLIRFIEQFENDAMANIDENMEPITNIIEQLDKSINEKMNMESAKHQSIEKESQQNNSNKTDEIGEINENQWYEKEMKIIFNSSTIFNQQLLPIYVSSVPFHVV